MGQAISRNAGIRASYNKVIERAQTEMEKAMKDNIKKDKYGFSDPSAAIGFTRGMDQIVQPTPEEEETIRQQNEMPPVSFGRFLQRVSHDASHYVFLMLYLLRMRSLKELSQHYVIFFIRIWSNS